MGKDMIIFSGQSNMQGQTDRLPDDMSPVAGAYEYRFIEDSLTPLKHPVGENISFDLKLFDPASLESVQQILQTGALLASHGGMANMVPSFCKSYIKETKREVVAVHVAKGSTKIEYWLEESKGYEVLRKKVKAAIEKVKPDNIYFAWLQGESDAIYRTSREEYKESILKLNESLKRDFGIKKFGIILVGKFTMDERDFEIINAQKETVKENDDFLMLTEITEEIFGKEEYMNPYEFGHYSCTGQELIGKEAGKTLGRYEMGNL